VGAIERLVLFPICLLHDLLGVVMLSTIGYEFSPPIEGYTRLSRDVGQPLAELYRKHLSNY